MKTSLNWLSQLVDIDGLTAQEVADKLTLAGLECGEVEVLGGETLATAVVTLSGKVSADG